MTNNENSGVPEESDESEGEIDEVDNEENEKLLYEDELDDLEEENEEFTYADVSKVVSLI